MKRILFCSLFGVGMLFGPTEQLAAQGRRAETERKETLRWLDRSLAAQRAIGTAIGSGRLIFSEATDPTNPITRIGIEEIRYRRMPSDTVCGFWFSAHVIDPDGHSYRTMYNSEAVYVVEDGDSTMEVLPAKEAENSLLFLGEWHERLTELRASLALSDSAFRQFMTGRFNDVGRVRLAGDTVIDGRRCRLVRNDKTDTLPRFRVWFRQNELWALDRKTALPVYCRTHYERRQRGEMTTNQLTEQWIDDFRLETPLDDTIFRSPGLPIRTEIPRAEVGDSTRMYWDGGQDILGRWPERTFSDSTMAGRFVVLDFSYKGCAYCQLALPVFDSVAQSRAGDDRVQFLMVDPVDTRTAAAEFARMKGIAYPVLSVDERFAASFGLYGYPAFVILGPDGKVCWMLRGFPNNKRRLAELLGSELNRLLGKAMKQ